MKPNLCSKLTMKGIILISVISFSSFHSCKQVTVEDVTFPVEKDLFSESFEVPPINRKALIYYDAIKATNKYIYAISEETQFDNLLENIPKLEVWDWDGNPVIQFKLDRTVSAFEVTQDDKMIYFIDRQTQDRIFTYDLDGLLK